MKNCLMVVEPAQFLQLAALPTVRTRTAACATSGVGMATRNLAAVFVTRAGAPMGEEEALYLSNTARQADLRKKVDFAIKSAEKITKR